MLTEENRKYLDKLNSAYMQRLFIERINPEGVILSFIMSTIFSYLYGPLAFVVGFILVFHRYIVFDIKESKTLKEYNNLFLSSGFEKDTVHDNKNGISVRTPIWKLKNTPFSDVYIKRLIS